jgi:hypothetical protein
MVDIIALGKGSFQDLQRVFLIMPAVSAMEGGADACEEGYFVRVINDVTFFDCFFNRNGI